MKVAILFALVAATAAQFYYPGYNYQGYHPYHHQHAYNGYYPFGYNGYYPGNYGNGLVYVNPYTYAGAVKPVPAATTFAKTTVPAVRPVISPAQVAVVPVPAPVVKNVADNKAEIVDPNPKYDYAYNVADPTTGDFKTAHEVRDNGVVSGSYSVVEPDGNLRTVEYTADAVNGFNAIVKNTPGAAAPAPVPVAKTAAVVAAPHAHHAHHHVIPAVRPAVLPVPVAFGAAGPVAAPVAGNTVVFNSPSANYNW